MMNVISKLSNKEVAELVQNLSNGVPIATQFLMELAQKILQKC